MSVFRSRKAMEMTVGVVIAIVLGLIIVAILFFGLRSKTNVLSDAGTCSGDRCIIREEPCPEGTEKGYSSCTKDGQKGWCCMDSLDG